PEARTRIIPNGISVSRFQLLRMRRAAQVPPVVAFIGRVVSIKEVKTFIRAVFIASRDIPELEAWVIVPDNEDPQYAREWRDLVGGLGMQERWKFLGMQRIDDLLLQVSVVALSSCSEGLTLVSLEAFAAGVPVVSTD